MSPIAVTPSSDTTAGAPASAAWPPGRHLRLPPDPAGALLLDATAAGPADRVLILGAPSAELMCEALRHGCRAAQEAATPPKRPDPADVVVATRVTTEADAAVVAACACRALAESRPGGRLAMLLPAASALGRSIAARLRGFGFDRISLRPGPRGDVLLVCRLRPARLLRA